MLSPQAKVEGRKRRRKAHRLQTHTGLNILAGRWKILVAWERKYVSLFSVGEWPVEGGGVAEDVEGVSFCPTRTCQWKF